MKNINKTLKNELEETLVRVINSLNPKNQVKVEVDWPVKDDLGDYTTNLAMQLTGELKQPPLEIAGKIIELLKKQPLAGKFFKIEAVAPGFINFYLKPDYLSKKAEEILNCKSDFGVLETGKGKKVQLEFISANPTGPLTLGNGRGGFHGDTLANILQRCGFKVTREYLINDAGHQIEVLGHSVLKDDQAVYHGEYIEEVIKKIGSRVTKMIPYQVGELAAKIILRDYIRKTVEEKMKIKFDVWFSETAKLRKKGRIAKVIKFLEDNNLVYKKDNAVWFKSSDYGDSRDRVLIKSDGETTYLAQDFAYLENKFRVRKFDRVINIWGADHHGDVPALLNAAKVLGFEGRQEILLMQFVRLYKNGQEVRMSKRAGNYVTMSELINLIGHDSARFNFLTYSTNTHIDFELTKAMEKSDKNPVYYVQYAYARLCGILRQPQVAAIKKISEIKIDHSQEHQLVKEILRWPEILLEISEDYQVQKLTAYATTLADRFHQFYTNCRVVDDGKVITSRVALCRLTKKILKEVLETIGVNAPEKM